MVALLGMWMLWRAVREAWAHRAGAGAHHHHHDHGHGETRAGGGRRAGAKAALVVLAVGVQALQRRRDRPAVRAGTQGVLGRWCILAALAMSVGTAITVSVLAGLSVALRRGALTLTSTSNRWQTIAANTLGIAGAAVVTLFGVTFFAAAL